MERKENTEGYAVAEIVGILQRGVLEANPLPPPSKSQDFFTAIVREVYSNLESYFVIKNKEVLKSGELNSLREEVQMLNACLDNERERADIAVDKNCQDANEIARLLDKNTELQALLESASDGNLNMKEYLEKKDEQIDKLLSILDAVVAGKV